MGKNRHPFGNLIDEHLSRKPGLSKAWLARQIDADPAVITHMCQGRRLTDRKRIVEIVRCLHTNGVLEYEEEATALLEAAGLCRLRRDDSVDLPSRGQGSGATGQRLTSRWKSRGPVAVALVLVALVGLGALADCLIARSPSTAVWQEDFCPLQGSRWTQVSAAWDDVPGPTAVLMEDDPNENFGKVETEVITVDADLHPILRVNATDVARHTSYTVQILDKQTDVAKDVLEGITYPGEHLVDIAAKMGWEGSHAFTINIWIGGDVEPAMVTFDLVSIEVGQ